jgi:hypothetical protein
MCPMYAASLFLRLGWDSYSAKTSAIAASVARLVCKILVSLADYLPLRAHNGRMNSHTLHIDNLSGMRPVCSVNYPPGLYPERGTPPP